jgi:6-phosphogluconolactonase/glucosamine-6-phosphate isomerase/deaminase
MAQRLLLDRAPVRQEMIHTIPTDLESVADAARAYEGELQRFYGAARINPARPLFDIVLMGMGRDGHTASLFPNRVQLGEQQRWVVEVPDPALEPFVPRVTLTFPVLAATREMLFRGGRHPDQDQGEQGPARESGACTASSDGRVVADEY